MADFDTSVDVDTSSPAVDSLVTSSTPSPTPPAVSDVIAKEEIIDDDSAGLVNNDAENIVQNGVHAEMREDAEEKSANNNDDAVTTAGETEEVPATESRDEEEVTEVVESIGEITDDDSPAVVVEESAVDEAGESDFKLIASLVSHYVAKPSDSSEFISSSVNHAVQNLVAEEENIEVIEVKDEEEEKKDNNDKIEVDVTEETPEVSVKTEEDIEQIEVVEKTESTNDTETKDTETNDTETNVPTEGDEPASAEEEEKTEAVHDEAPFVSMVAHTISGTI